MNIVKMWEKFRRSKRQYLSLQDFIEEATVKLHFETDEDVIDALLDAKAAMALERSNSQPASSNLSIEEARELVENYPKRIEAAFENLEVDKETKNDFCSHFLALFRQIIRANSLLSCERGREEQRKETIEKFKDVCLLKTDGDVKYFKPEFIEDVEIWEDALPRRIMKILNNQNQ